MASLIPDKPADRPTVPQVLPFVRAYYNDHAAGGSLHIALDDGNLEDGNIQYCIDSANERGDDAGAALGRLLLEMTRTQRAKVYRMKWSAKSDVDIWARLVVRDGSLAFAYPPDSDYGPDVLEYGANEVRAKLQQAAERLKGEERAR
jgi:hypothetical protein